MKSRIAASLLLSVAAVLLAASPVKAVPTLQLDFAGGSYDTLNEDIVPGGTATLYALLVEDQDTFTTSTFCLSIAIIDLADYNGVDNAGIGSGDDWGSFDFDGTTYSFGGANFGTPPVGTVNPDDLQSHGVFETQYFELSVDFTTGTVLADSSYNAQDGDHNYPLPTGDGGMYVKLLGDFDISGLNAGFGLHIDLYQKGENGEVVEFAPFSHDASIPEPTGFVLTLAGLTLFGLIRRKTK